MQPACNLIVDSCCDLPFEVVNREGIELVKFPFIMDGEERLDDLGQTLSPRDFYHAMRAGAEPSTAQVPMAVYQETFRRALESGVPTVYLCFSSGLSGSFDVAALVLESLKGEYPDGKLYLVDTKLASVAEALLVYEAIRQRDRGLTAEELVTWAEEARYFIDEAFMVDDLEALRRGGRIPATVAYAGSKLDVKPLLTITSDGKLTLMGVARGRKKGIKQLADYYAKQAARSGPEQCVVIGNADCPKDAERLKDALAKIDANLLFLESSIGPVIGSHVGPGMVAVVFWGSDQREELSVADRIARKVRGGRKDEEGSQA
ncbi:DegV family EDD domain-containing protein [Eggerthellaceae bacterium zg-893]|nr:DegV family EDD domain-containing protein [Eggerthellaceae bacterium zg-893]